MPEPTASELWAEAAKSWGEAATAWDEAAESWKDVQWMWDHPFQTIIGRKRPRKRTNA